MKKQFLLIIFLSFIAFSCSAQYPDHDGLFLTEAQGLQDWHQLADDQCTQIVYIEASNGDINRNLWYEYYLRNARQHYMPVGSCHLLTSTASLLSQMENFKGAARKTVQDLIPMIIISSDLLTATPSSPLISQLDTLSSSLHYNTTPFSLNPRPSAPAWTIEQVNDSLLAFIALCERYYAASPIIGIAYPQAHLLDQRFNVYHRCLFDCDSLPADTNASLWVDKHQHLHMLTNISNLLIRYPRDMYFQHADSLPDGIDVSRHQHRINWDTLAQANLQYAFVRATLGVETEDEQYERNIKEARRIRLKVGAYHYLSSKVSAREQFFWFYHHVKREDIDFPPMLDVEETKKWNRQQLLDSINVWVALCEKYYGVRPILYTYQSFYNAYLHPHFQDFTLFLARYSNAAPTIYTKAYGHLWQYTCQGRLPGINSSYVDLSKLHKDFNLSSILLQPFTAPNDAPAPRPHKSTHKKKKR